MAVTCRDLGKSDLADVAHQSNLGGDPRLLRPAERGLGWSLAIRRSGLRAVSATSRLWTLGRLTSLDSGLASVVGSSTGHL